MARVTAIIAEDETVLREELRCQLATLWPELEICALAADGVEALGLFDRYRPSIMFLDIQMPVLSGLDVARQLAGRCQVVFITAFDSYAIAAFEHGAVDYLLKPYDSSRLAAAVQRIRDRVAGTPPPLEQILRDLSIAARPPQYLRWIKALLGASTELVLVDDICFFQAAAKYTGVFTGEREMIIRMPVKELIERLDPERFWQINRSTIVQVAAIASVRRGIGGSMQIRLSHRPERLTVSETHRHRFRHM